MKEALDKAVQAGWNRTSTYSQAFLDPLFWQALGKQQGWRNPESRNSENRFNGQWMQNWEDFIQHIAEGKLIDDFFTNLLK